MAGRPRVLVFDNKPGEVAHDFPGWDVTRVVHLGEGLAKLHTEKFDGIYTPSRDQTDWKRVLTLLQNEFVLEALGEGVALVHPDLRILWANSIFEKWSGSSVAGRSFYEALGNPEILGPDYCPFHTSLVGKIVFTRLHRQNHQYLELRVTPLIDASNKVQYLVALVRDISGEVQQQQKLDALHHASEELTSLRLDQLEAMSLEERVELLKHNIRRLTHDLLHYDVIEIRLLQPDGELTSLLAEGMTTEAAARTLYANADGNGVTGFVAETGKSYVCNDTTVDPLYIQGAEGAKSSLTVPLKWDDKVIGTFNVESPNVNGFSELDVQFTEIFSREVASALHTLQLLTVEKRIMATQSIDAINREVAMPVDEILNSATLILDRWIGHEPEMAEKLKKICASARQIKQSIQKVGENLAPGANAIPSQPAEEQPSKLRDLRVLVVDNDDRVRRSAHSILGRLGCTVETARDGKEALTMARLGGYDVMLADIRLPDLSGYEVFRQLKEAQPSARVILMTGYGYDPSHSIVKARAEGLKFILFKPFRVDQLVDALLNREPTPTISKV